MAETILIVVAHPDDEVLGVGGTAARHADQGDAVHVLIVAQGAAARTSNGSALETDVDDLRQAATQAAEILGTQSPRFIGLPDNRLDSLDLLDVVKAVEEVVVEVNPTVIYTHHGGDLNIDHEIVHRATLTACRPQPACPVRTIYTFETPSATDWGSPELAHPFIPNRYVEISDTLSRKQEALEVYAMEMRPFPHARSIEAVVAMARFRGSQVGFEAAEAFAVMRDLWPRKA